MRALVYACTAWQYATCRVAGRLWSGVYFSVAGPARLTDVTPPPMRPGWCLVRVHQCGLCASDLHLIRLHFSLASAPLAGAARPGVPFILGPFMIPARAPSSQGLTRLNFSPYTLSARALAWALTRSGLWPNR